MKKFYISLFICLLSAVSVYANDIPNAGLGIVLQKVNNQIVVQKFLPHCNMETNKLRTGDIITEVGGISTENLSLKDVQTKFIGEKDSRISVKILRKEEYENFWGKKMSRLVPIEISNIPRNYEIDRDLPVRVFKDGDKYNIKMNYQNKNLSCNVIYRKEKSQYLRVLRCSEAVNYNSYTKEYKYSFSGTDVKVPIETWINFDKLILKKYNKCSLWHNSPNPIITGGKELQLAKLANPAPPKNGTPCGSPTTGGIGVWKNGTCYIDMTKDMTEKEKEDYFRYKDFEENYENYLKYRNGVY